MPNFSYAFGGPVTVVRSISRELSKRHEVVIYTTTALDLKHDFASGVKKEDGYEVVFYKRTLKQLSYSGIFGQLNLSYEMLRAAKEHLRDFDLVHVHSWHQFPDILFHHYAKKYNIPYVLQVHGSLPRTVTKQNLKLFFDLTFGRGILNDASKVIALTIAEANQYRDYGVPREKIAVVPNAIDLTEYHNLPPPGLFRSKFEIENDRKIILYLGRINRSKGLDFLLKAYAYLVKEVKYLGALLVIAGPDDGYLQHTKSLVNSLELNNLVLFTGKLSKEDKFKAYVDSTVCTYLSKYEPFGLVTLEAAACGTPVLVSEDTPLANVVKDNGFGSAVKYNDVIALATNLRKIMEDNNLRTRMSERGRAAVSKDFNLSNIVVKLERVYEDTLKHRF